jgi:hypothetical protein
LRYSGIYEEVDYIPALASLFQDGDVRLVNWLFLYAMEDDGSSSLDWKLFGSASLRTGVTGTGTGAKRPAYDAWVAR